MTWANRTVVLIARREIVTRVQTKAFRISLLVMIIVIAVGAALPGLLSDDGPAHYDVGLGASTPAGLAAALAAAAKAQDAGVTVHPLDSAASAQHQVKDGDLDAALFGTDLFAESSTSTVAVLVQGVYQAAEVQQHLRDTGLSAAQVSQALAVPALQVQTTHDSQTAERQVIATIVIIFFFGQLVTFCTWVGVGVVEEKASRVIEILLGAVRPVQLLAGKIIGFGAVALLQAVGTGAVALAVAGATGSISVPASVYASVAVSTLWFLLGYLFFAALSAALAALVSRQEEVSSVLAPMTVLLFLAYGGGFAAAGAPDSGLAKVVSVLPPFSALAMPARMARGGVPVGLVALAMLIMLVATAAVLWVGARIYRASILHNGSRLSVKAAWHAEA